MSPSLAFLAGPLTTVVESCKKTKLLLLIGNMMFLKYIQSQFLNISVYFVMIVMSWHKTIEKFLFNYVKMCCPSSCFSSSFMCKSVLVFILTWKDVVCDILTIDSVKNCTVFFIFFYFDLISDGTFLQITRFVWFFILTLKNENTLSTIRSDVIIETYQ